MRVLKPEIMQLLNPRKSHAAVNYITEFFDHIQRGMNPEADPHIWPYCFKTELEFEKLREKLEEIGFKLDYPFQHYKDQALSGHIFYKDGHQLHMRAFPLKKGGYGLKAHYEWSAETNPIRHLACKDISYPKGCRMLKKLWFGPEAKGT